MLWQRLDKHGVRGVCVHIWCLECHVYCLGVYAHCTGARFLVNFIGVTVLIPYVIVFVVTVLQTFLASTVFGCCPSTVTTRLIVNIGMAISICQSIPWCDRPLSLYSMQCHFLQYHIEVGIHHLLAWMATLYYRYKKIQRANGQRNYIYLLLYGMITTMRAACIIGNLKILP